MADADVFISYSREDQPTARLYAEALTREGFNVWWDQALRSGEAFD
jgi:TIR domain